MATAMRGNVGDVGNMPEATSRTGNEAQAHIVRLRVSRSSTYAVNGWRVIEKFVLTVPE